MPSCRGCKTPWAVNCYSILKPFVGSFLKPFLRPSLILWFLGRFLGRLLEQFVACFNSRLPHCCLPHGYPPHGCPPHCHLPHHPFDFNAQHDTPNLLGIYPLQLHALQTSLHRQAALFAIKYICIQDFKKNVWWNLKKPLYIFFAWMHGFFKTSSFELKTQSFE